MKTYKYPPVFLLVLLFSILIIAAGYSPTLAQDEESSEEKVNAVSLFSGAYILKYPDSYNKSELQGVVENFSPEALIDGSQQNMWCSEEGEDAPFVFIFELVEPFIISELEFNTFVENYNDISAREVMVEIAPTLKGKYQTVLKTTLDKFKVSKFSIEPTEARLIRLTILSNYGNDDFTELAEFSAWGKRKYGDIETIDIGGEWESNWGDLEFKQTGTLVTGKYEFNDGKIRFGGIQRNKVTYTWIEDVINKKGNTIMFLNEEGTRLIGVWCFDNNWNEYGFWIIERDEGIPFKPIVEQAVEKAETVQEEAQPQVVKEEVVETKKDDSATEEMKKELMATRKITLYGINFRTNSAVILSESYPVLRQVIEVLKSAPNIRIRIEGHTDNVGPDAKNLKLSADRANSVKTYLTENGIDASRMIVEGRGEAFPVADNSTDIGRSLNRRVEIHVID